MNRRGFIGRVIGGALALLGIGAVKATEPALDHGALFPELPEWFKVIDCRRMLQPPGWDGSQTPNGNATFFATGRVKEPIAEAMGEWTEKSMKIKRKVKMYGKDFVFGTCDFVAVIPTTLHVNRHLFTGEVSVLWNAMLRPCE